MKEEVSLQELINKLTEHRNNTENFLKSLRFIDNGVKIANFLKTIIYKYDINIIRGFDYEIEGAASEFKEILFSGDFNKDDIDIPEDIQLIKTPNYFILLLK